MNRFVLPISDQITEANMERIRVQMQYSGWQAPLKLCAESFLAFINPVEPYKDS
jgi:hypothetical protein